MALRSRSRSNITPTLARPSPWPIGSGSRRRALALALTTALLVWPPEAFAGPAEYQEVFGEIELEATGFAEAPQFPGQKRHATSIAGKATLLLEWKGGDLSFKFTPFGRIDEADDKRTHFDIRELKVDRTSGPWTATLGADTVFWGKTEAVHLIDIINQTDSVEDLDDEDRLGQPMARIAYLAEAGEFSAFFMPYFRERTFAGAHGRLRSALPVDKGSPIYDTSAEEWTPAAALRFAGVFDDIDLGASAFYGLGRDPSFVFQAGQLRPFYELIGQIGLDAQYTSGPTLWKLEAIGRINQKNRNFVNEDFIAATGGLEHTLFAIDGDNMDLGLIAEYAIDSRFANATSIFQNDAIFGARLALNDPADTSMLLTSAIDLQSAETGLRLEASRRILDDLTLGIEGQAFLNTDKQGLASSLKQDSYLRVKLTYYFGGGA